MIVQSFVGDLLGADVAGNLYYYRTGASVAEIVERSPHNVGNLVGLKNNLPVFRDALVGAHR